jgi:hypothetical protein
MDVENAANILAGSILTGLAFIIAVVVIVIINNIFSKYWKPVQWIKYEDRFPSARFVTEEELVKSGEKKEPTIVNEIKS